MRCRAARGPAQAAQRWLVHQGRYTVVGEGGTGGGAGRHSHAGCPRIQPTRVRFEAALPGLDPAARRRYCLPEAIAQKRASRAEEVPDQETEAGRALTTTAHEIRNPTPSLTTVTT